MLGINFYTNILANIVITDYFSASRCLLIFTGMKNRDFNYIGETPSVKILLTTNSTIKSDLVFRNYRCQSVIINAENAIDIFVEFENAIRLENERFNKRQFLIIPVLNNNNTKKFENEFFALQELEFVSDIILMVPQAETEHEVLFALKTHKYVGLSNCNEPILIDVWSSKNLSFVLSNHLLPDKLSNQQGRFLRMAMFHYEPYSIIGNGSNVGFESSVMMEYVKKYNLTPFPVINDIDYWGEIFKNWSGNGLVGNLVEDKADIGFSGLISYEDYYVYFDLTNPLVKIGFTCLVPAPKLATGWLTPLFAFSSQLWICVVITVTTIILVILLIMISYDTMKIWSKHIWFTKHIPAAFTIMAKPLFLQSLTPKEIPHEPANKLLFGWILIMSIFLTSFYNSGVSSVMTVPRYETPINTVEDFAAKGVKWRAPHEDFKKSLVHAEEPHFKQIVENFKALPEDELQYLFHTEEFAFAIERLPYHNFAIGRYVTEDAIAKYHVMSEDFHWKYCVILARKNSILLPSVNDFVLRVHQAGLFSIWLNHAVEYMDTSVQKAVKFHQHHYANEKKFARLKWVQIEGAVAVLVLGYCLSFAIFIIEVVKQRK